MELMYFWLGVSAGIIFASVSMAIAWIYDTKDEHIRLKDARDQAYKEGYQKGTIWKYRQMIAAERELGQVRAEIEELKENQ